MRTTTKKILKNDFASTIESIDMQIDELLAEISLVQEKSEFRDEELDDLYWETNSLKERMHNVAQAYRLD